MEREMRTSHLEWMFLGLPVVGTAMPLAAFLPWLSQYGLDVPRFLVELFGSRVGAFFAWDVLIAALAVLVAVAVVPGINSVQRVVVGVGTLLVRVSCGLPVLLYFWVRAGVVR